MISPRRRSVGALARVAACTISLHELVFLGFSLAFSCLEKVYQFAETGTRGKKNDQRVYETRTMSVNCAREYFVQLLSPLVDKSFFS